ncbi:cyclic nucleotide-binding domain-containing protein [Thiomonas arsenitoxydans]|uniref:cyclic nucleotide-binding domain-containing protein n=1 Tax=Thiomonas arsenitoxydans (strain DSM 22701 / CIP 110005 / 3As) TaxID=426114 RepID=UPI0023F223E9|nr:cyclic nucleotide-binding domain-containing protein [Thiomonas arsenitoxydans]
MKRHPIPAQFRSHHPHPCDGNLPADLNAVLRQRVTEAAEATLELSRGETLVHSGMPFKHLYLVVSGGFKAVEIGENGQSQIVSFHYARELGPVNAIDATALPPDGEGCKAEVRGKAGRLASH